METFERFHLQILKKRIESEPIRFIQVLYGPRQVGKTTLVRQLLHQTELPWHYSSADGVAASDAVWISQQWEAARIKCRSNEQQSAILVIDEVQKVENWSEQVKKEWDRDRAGEVDLQVILLGSSRLLLQRGLTESLAGRYESTYMGHWSYPEMNSAFGLSADEFVWFGGYPGSAALIDDESRWKQYVRDSLIETTVSKDILMMTRVDKPALMKQLFELGCEFSGQILSYNKMLGQLHDAGNTTTLSHYLHLLDTAGLLAGLDKFSPNKIRKRASSPKLQVHNTALMSAQYPESFEKLKGRPAEWGRWVESAVGAHLLNATLNSDLKLMYWRHSNDEVDFVLQKGEQVIGIEVKSGSGKRTGGMQAFSKKFSPEKVLLVGDEGLAWQEFLELNPEELF
ncbi:MAG: ATP-binding protein [Melioribacteraceae bacterium]|nr:ATP-binding protein [Melioribacteraceae bacterium]